MAFSGPSLVIVQQSTHLVHKAPMIRTMIHARHHHLGHRHLPRVMCQKAALRIDSVARAAQCTNPVPIIVNSARSQNQRMATINLLHVLHPNKVRLTSNSHSKLSIVAQLQFRLI